MDSSGKGDEWSIDGSKEMILHLKRRKGEVGRGGGIKERAVKEAPRRLRRQLRT